MVDLMPYENHRDGSSLSDESQQSVSASSAPTNFQSALLLMIESAAKNPSQLRGYVYELARANLRREIWNRRPPPTAVEVKECTLALETAISRVEADSARGEYTNSSIPRLQIGPMRLEAESPRQLPVARSADLKNAAPGLHNNNSDATEPPSTPLQLRENFEEPHPPPIILGYPEDPVTPANPSRPSHLRANIDPDHRESGSMCLKPDPIAVDLDLRPSHTKDSWSSGDGNSDWDSLDTPGSFVIPRASPDRADQPEAEQSDYFALRPELLVWRNGLQAPPGVARFQRPQVEIVYSEREDKAARTRRRAWLWFIAWPIIALTGPTAFLAVYLAFVGRFAAPTAGPKAQQPISEIATSGPSGLPLPSNYGVYAINNGVLNELQPLSIRAPDPRVALSAEIKTPSQTLLPDGNVIFIVFRRDLVNSAPQKLAVRVVARIARATTLSSGKTISEIRDGTWRIRSISFDFKVSPLNDNREMVVVRPEMADFAFPAGRYVLVLGALAYDFTVAGLITAAPQCLEAFELLNGPIFSECRTK